MRQLLPVGIEKFLARRRPRKNKKAEVRVIMIFEDIPSGKEIITAYDLILQRFGNEYDFDSHLWNFNGLRDCRIREMAAEEAAEADLILVSAHGENHLSLHVRAWLEMALEMRSRRSGILGLMLDREHMTPNSNLGIYLQNAAWKAGMEFISTPNFASASRRPAKASGVARNTKPSLIDGFLAHTLINPRWSAAPA